ncbi:MAG TPA: lysoplasmalogenase [Ferrovibrio sp.]|uniref:lysoplasmalogenase n=1 Tax=Ferrovibrio sp. TaxID=1917215 RepID=UPI002ED06302
MNDAARQNPSGAPFFFPAALAAALLMAGLYLLLPPLAAPLWPTAAVKGAVCPCLALALWASRGGDRPALLGGLALLASAAGDVLLAADGARLFVPGLAAFLVAHLLYIALFVIGGRAAGRMTPIRWALAAAILFHAVGMAIFLAPHLGRMAVPVYAYLVVISMMGLSAVRLGRWLVIFGALSFMLSDSLLALNKFVQPISHIGPAIWIAYVAAQGMIVLGWRNRGGAVQ